MGIATLSTIKRPQETLTKFSTANNQSSPITAIQQLPYIAPQIMQFVVSTSTSSGGSTTLDCGASQSS